jgi:hypothetical protein
VSIAALSLPPQSASNSGGNSINTAGTSNLPRERLLREQQIYARRSHPLSSARLFSLPSEAAFTAAVLQGQGPPQTSTNASLSIPSRIIESTTSESSVSNMTTRLPSYNQSSSASSQRSISSSSLLPPLNLNEGARGEALSRIENWPSAWRPLTGKRLDVERSAPQEEQVLLQPYRSIAGPPVFLPSLLAYTPEGSTVAADDRCVGLFAVICHGGQSFRSSVQRAVKDPKREGNDRSSDEFIWLSSEWYTRQNEHGGLPHQQNSGTSGGRKADPFFVSRTGGGATDADLAAEASGITSTNSSSPLSGISLQKRALTPAFSSSTSSTSFSPSYASPSSEFEWDGGGVYVSFPVYYPGLPIEISVYEARRVWRYAIPSSASGLSQEKPSLQCEVIPVLVGSALIPTVDVAGATRRDDGDGGDSLDDSVDKSTSIPPQSSSAFDSIQQTNSSSIPSFRFLFTGPAPKTHWVHLESAHVDSPWVGGKGGEILHIRGEAASTLDSTRSFLAREGDMWPGLPDVTSFTTRTTDRATTDIYGSRAGNNSDIFSSRGLHRPTLVRAQVSFQYVPKESLHSSIERNDSSNKSSSVLSMSESSPLLLVSPVLSREGGLHTVDLLNEIAQVMGAALGRHETTISIASDSIARIQLSSSSLSSSSSSMSSSSSSDSFISKESDSVIEMTLCSNDERYSNQNPSTSSSTSSPNAMTTLPREREGEGGIA